MEDMERRLEKQQLCWNAISMDDSSDDMGWVDEDQEHEWSVVESIKKKETIRLKAVALLAKFSKYLYS